MLLNNCNDSFYGLVQSAAGGTVPPWNICVERDNGGFVAAAIDCRDRGPREIERTRISATAADPAHAVVNVRELLPSTDRLIAVACSLEHLDGCHFRWTCLDSDGRPTGLAREYVQTIT